MNMAEVAREIVGSGPLSVLVAGSGPDRLPDWEQSGCRVTYMDIEPRTNPDIVGDMTNLGIIGPYNVIYCCHALEHLYPHQVFQALQEFKRVLMPGGIAMVLVPDLEDVRPTEEVLYVTGSGPYCGLQLYYGDFREIPEFPHMAHHSGFVKETLKKALDVAGFDKSHTERLENYHLMGIGVKAA